jgi:hypothetical protein
MGTDAEWGPAGKSSFSVGQRVRIVRAPSAYGYNGRSASIIAMAGDAITLAVDDPPSDIACTLFYSEELEHEESR